MPTGHDARSNVTPSSTAVEDRLIAAGYPVRADELYIEGRDNAASNQSILDLVNVIGLIIVAISMVSLTTTITMSILERTREFGVPLFNGAHSKDIYRDFAAEAVSIGGSDG